MELEMVRVQVDEPNKGSDAGYLNLYKIEELNSSQLIDKHFLILLILFRE